VDRSAARAVVAAALDGAEDVWLDAGQGHRLLEAYGIPLAPEVVAVTPVAAAAAASAMGGAVVVKSAAAGAHKSETGGVQLDVRGDEAVRAAAARIGGPVLVQPMLEGAELIAGVVRDPVFGPLIALGLGGVLTELVAAASVAVAPLTDIDAIDLVMGGPVGRLMTGFRGHAPLDAAATADLLHRLSALSLDVPEIAELDLNPVLVSSSGCVAVDRRIRVCRPARSSRSKSW
jgi:succinyl-CoA synthetase beta subunit